MSEAFSYYHEEARMCFEEGYKKHMQGEIQDAIALYSKSIELSPTAEAHTFLGWAYSTKGSYNQAIMECHKAIEIDPDYGNPYNDIGSYFIETGKFDEAIPWLEKALKAKRYDNYCYPYYNLGRVYEKKGVWDKAMKNYKNSLIENSQYKLAKKAMNRLLSLHN